DPPPKTCRPPAVRTVEGLQVWGVQQPRRWETTGSEMAVGGTVALSGYRLPSPEPGTAGTTGRAFATAPVGSGRLPVESPATSVRPVAPSVLPRAWVSGSGLALAAPAVPARAAATAAAASTRFGESAFMPRPTRQGVPCH